MLRRSQIHFEKPKGTRVQSADHIGRNFRLDGFVSKDMYGFRRVAVPNDGSLDAPRRFVALNGLYVAYALLQRRDPLYAARHTVYATIEGARLTGAHYTQFTVAAIREGRDPSSVIMPDDLDCIERSLTVKEQFLGNDLYNTAIIAELSGACACAGVPMVCEDVLPLRLETFTEPSWNRFTKLINPAWPV